MTDPSFPRLSFCLYLVRCVKCLSRGPFSPFILIADPKPCLLWLPLTILLSCLSLLDAACLIAGLFLCITIYLLSLKARIYSSHLLLHIYQHISSLHHSPRPTRLAFLQRRRSGYSSLQDSLGTLYPFIELYPPLLRLFSLSLRQPCRRPSSKYCMSRQHKKASIGEIFR